MIVVFDKVYLRDLYESGKCPDKKHRFQPEVIRKYQRGINYLKAAQRIEDLFRVNSLNFEALSGDKRGLFSIRAGRQYRIEFRIEEGDEQSLVSICNILELSNHYE